jgi:AhpD family alkylhydroperoxidase
MHAGIRPSVVHEQASVLCSIVRFPSIAKAKMMQDFPVHTIASAPEQSRPALEALQAAFGMVPNIAGAMATSPVLINSLVGLFQRVHGGSFSEAQIQVLLLTNAVTNACEWAVAFHTALAFQAGVDATDVQAIRVGRAPADGQQAALSVLAKTLIEKRGRLDDQDVDRFIGAGFGKDHLLEVIAVVAASTITNYTGSVTKPPVEGPFQSHIWTTQ